MRYVLLNKPLSKANITTFKKERSFMTNTKMFSKLIAITFAAIIFLLSGMSSINASAATCGGANSATVIVSTYKNYWRPGASSITLRQNPIKITYTKYGNSKRIKTKSYYPSYNISVFNATTGKQQTINWNSSSSKKITLDGDCTYWITVSRNTTQNQLKEYGLVPWGGYYQSGYSDSSWWVNSTNKVRKNS